jgi:pyrroloquinoline quinone biosynthesis protein B
MRARVLGSAAGGGFPQWNCACRGCELVRHGSPLTKPRTQDSIAISADGERWFLLNASPDVLRQIECTPALQPRHGRASPIAGVVLTNGDLDHCLGLLSLRESHPLVVYATRAVLGGLVDQNAMLRTLSRPNAKVRYEPLPLGSKVELRDASGHEVGLHLTARPAPGKPPLHLDGRVSPSPEDNVGLWVTSANADARPQTLAYVSSTADVGALRPHLAECDVLLFDGTFWSEDELPRLGLGTARARDMAHLPLEGERGSLARLAGLPVARKLFTHVNNTNPILIEGSDERNAALRAGFAVAEDGMELFA